MMPLPVAVYLFPYVPLSLLLHFIPLCGALVVLVLALSSYLGCLALLIYVLHYLYMYMVAFLALRILYVVALVCFVFVPCFFPLLNPFLAMMSSAGYSHARFLFFSFLFRPCSSPICFGVTSSVTTAGFVADQLIM